MNSYINQCKEFVLDFIRKNKMIAFIGFLATAYCSICVIFKTSPTLNVTIELQPLGEFLCNVSISVIAAVIFYIFQVYLPNKRRTEILTKYAKKFICDYLLNECRKLSTRIDCIYKGTNTENEIKEAIHINSQKVKHALTESLNRYSSIMSDDLIEAINAILFDDFFEMICIRASGELVNRSLKEIVKDRDSYNRLSNNIKIIKEEVEKM